MVGAVGLGEGGSVGVVGDVVGADGAWLVGGVGGANVGGFGAEKMRVDECAGPVGVSSRSSSDGTPLTPPIAIAPSPKAATAYLPKKNRMIGQLTRIAGSERIKYELERLKPVHGL